MTVDAGGDTKRQEFVYQADLWLADFTQQGAQDLVDLEKRLSALEKNTVVDSNADLRAAAMYFHATFDNKFDNTKAAAYHDAFLKGKTVSQVPFLGKLVLMTQIKSQLDTSGPAGDRIDKALTIDRELRELYPNYANGHVIAAALMSMQADALGSGANPNSTNATPLQNNAADELNRASALDPEMMRIVRLNNLELPVDLLKELDENPRNPALAKRLASYAATNIDPLARAILVSDVLTHQAVDMTLLQATRRGLGERRIAKAIAAIPTGNANPEARANAMLSIAQQFLDIDCYLPAENWLKSATKALGSEKAESVLTQKFDDLRGNLAKAKISRSLLAVI